MNKIKARDYSPAFIYYSDVFMTSLATFFCNVIVTLPFFLAARMPFVLTEGKLSWQACYSNGKIIHLQEISQTKTAGY